MTSSRRSARLQVIAKKASRRPRTKRRPSLTPNATSRRSLRTLTRPLNKSQKSKPGEASLLSLPDEVLAHIISRLSVSTPSLKAPPAFFLAQTNTRLLHIFRSQLTRITPYISNPTPTTLSHEHLAAVSWLAGEHLRVIHLPEGALWPELADVCPNVEELSFCDDWRSQSIVQYVFERLSLNVLEVVRPSPETLEMMNESASRLQKLVLKDISLRDIRPLLLILKAKPKELVLQFEFISFGDGRPLLLALERTIQNIEKIAISILSSTQAPDEDVGIIINRLRESGRKKTCKDVFLNRPELFHFLRHVDSNAKVALGHSGSIFQSNAPGEMIYATKLTTSHTPNVDVSRVRELTIDTTDHPDWIEQLLPLKHVRVLLNDMLPPVRTEIATLPIPTKPYAEWNLPTHEIRFEARHLFENEISGACEAIKAVLHSFTGRSVWMEYLRGFDLPRDRDALRRQIREVQYACVSFEKKGGDAGTVFAWLDAVFSMCF